MGYRKQQDSTFPDSFNRLLAETIALGVAPDRALKLWGMIVEAWTARDESC